MQFLGLLICFVFKQFLFKLNWLWRLTNDNVSLKLSNGKNSCTKCKLKYIRETLLPVEIISSFFFHSEDLSFISSSLSNISPWHGGVVVSFGTWYSIFSEFFLCLGPDIWKLYAIVMDQNVTFKSKIKNFQNNYMVERKKKKKKKKKRTLKGKLQNKIISFGKLCKLLIIICKTYLYVYILYKYFYFKLLWYL